jgi:hypothetical protein
MAVEFACGFDWFNSDTTLQRVFGASSSTSSYGTGRLGTGRTAGMQNRSIFSRGLTSKATRIVGWAIKSPVALPNDQQLLIFTDAGTNQVDVRLDSTGALRVTRNGTTLGTSATGLIAVSAIWYYLEFKATISDAAGSYELRINGINVLSGSSVDTKNTSNATADGWTLLCGNQSGWEIDDVISLDTTGSAPGNNFLGEISIPYDAPNADGATTNFIRSTGSTNFSCVDETSPNDDTDYVSSSTPGDIDLYSFPSRTINGTIVAVVNNLIARKDDIGTRVLSDEIRSGGSNSAGANQLTLTTSYAHLQQIRETDPATGVAWTNTGLNNVQLGETVVS